MFRSSSLTDDIILFEMVDVQSSADGESYIRALYALSARTEPVILIMLFTGHVKQDHETRKQAALWFRQNRDRLPCFAKGLIQVEPDHEHDHAEEIENSNFARMLPFPLKHAHSFDEAYALAKNWPNI